MSTCFIVMPLTCPESAIAQYFDDRDHFRHVLDHLFIPAVEKAKLEPIPPIASGSDLIHAEIVKQLESTDLVLCDISGLNANVFFELGIRTAVDKPVCLVKDSFTDKVPFDTGVLNHLTYDPSLAPWKLANEIERLADHIIASINRSQGRNTLWRHFGLTTRAELAPPESPIEEKLDLIMARLAEIDISAPTPGPPPAPSADKREDLIKWIIDRANAIAGELSAKFVDFKIDGESLVLDLGRFALPPSHVGRVMKLGKEHGIPISIINNSR
ncbi:MAG: hypothetical protein Q8S00_03830 [Deltaproteobacteria bacterium]|nr:hypothetical protein [Deltaproteobacteria bacterium]MDZ4341544.1 hypothetical protein [Candidatus Binatia bacterium]